MPSWRKVILSGSNAALNSLNVTTSITASVVSASNGFTGSLLGTSSYSSLSEKVIVTPSLYTPLARPIVVADIQSPGSILYVDLSQSRFTYAPRPSSGKPTVNLDGI